MSNRWTPEPWHIEVENDDDDIFGLLEEEADQQSQLLGEAVPPDAGDDSEEGDGLEKNKASSSSGPDPSRKVKHRTDAENIKFVLGENGFNLCKPTITVFISKSEDVLSAILGDIRTAKTSWRWYRFQVPFNSTE